MNFESVTIKDIAKELGISASSVSRALSDNYQISDKTKKQVLECSQKLNYQPNPMARSLKRGKSKTIGVVVPLIDNRFFSQVIDGIESIAHSKGYTVIFTQSRESSKLEMFNVDHLTSHSIDGLLISLSTETTDVSYLKILHTKGLPIVFFDRICDEIDTHKVITDNFTGALEGTNQLINEGYRKIAHITSSINVSITKEQLNGYKLALEQNNIDINEQHIRYCLYGGKNRKEIENILNELLDGESRPDAIFTASDMITTTTFSLLNQLKLRIPHDIALLGFTNVQEADVFNPSLSAIYQPGWEMGKKAAEMLIGLIESKRAVTDFETVMLPTQIHIRNSSLREEQ